MRVLLNVLGGLQVLSEDCRGSACDGAGDRALEAIAPNTAWVVGGPRSRGNATGAEMR